MSGKQNWPELVGKTGEEAKAIIQQENPALTELVVMPMGPATADYRENRVRIVVGDDGKVILPPCIG